MIRSKPLPFTIVPLGAAATFLCGIGWLVGCIFAPGNGQPSPGGSASCETDLPPALLTTGSVSAASTACASGQLEGGECYQATVSCPEVGDADAALKYHPATTESIGTVILTTGGGGTGLYEESFTYGAELIADLNDAGFATVQVAWDRGWNAGPGGVARLSCRYATLARWIHDELHEGGATQPLCATGNSGGSAQAAYAMSRYGLDELFDALVLSSGPPVARLDLGCACTPGMNTAVVPCGESTLCYADNRLSGIDDSYAGTPCQDECVDLLAADSVVTEGVDLDYPTTKVVAVFGSQDNSNAIAQAMQWYNVITSEVEILCVPEAGHPVASSLEGYETLRDQLIAECHVQP